MYCPLLTDCHACAILFQTVIPQVSLMGLNVDAVSLLYFRDIVIPAGQVGRVFQQDYVIRLKTEMIIVLRVSLRLAGSGFGISSSAWHACPTMEPCIRPCSWSDSPFLLRLFRRLYFAPGCSKNLTCLGIILSRITWQLVPNTTSWSAFWHAVDIFRVVCVTRYFHNAAFSLLIIACLAGEIF